MGMRFDPSRDNVLSERDDDKHNELRAKMAAGVGLYAAPRTIVKHILTGDPF